MRNRAFGDSMEQLSRKRAGVEVVVDSAASLPADMAERPGFHVVPMRLTLEGKSYRDGLDLTPTDLYQRLRVSPVLPTTSAPSPADFVEVLKKAAWDSESLLCLTVASTFSSSVDSARIAAREVEQLRPRLRVCVLDSESAAGGQGLIALEAWRMADAGAELGTVVSAARAVMARVRVLAFLDTLFYLWKGGRVPRIAHTGSSLLRIKPLFQLAQGRVKTIARPRTRKRAMLRLLDFLEDGVRGRRLHATVMHADAPDAAEELFQRLEGRFPVRELFISEFTPVMGAHIGPGLLGVAFWCEPP